MSSFNVQYVVNSEGKKTGVFLSYMQYHKLLEDLHDLQAVAVRRGEKPISTRELRRRLRRNSRV